MTADTAVIDCLPDITLPSSGTLGADFLLYQSGEMLMGSESGITWNNLQDRQTLTVFQIRRGNSDNLGIISHISP